MFTKSALHSCRFKHGMTLVVEASIMLTVFMGSNQCLNMISSAPCTSLPPEAAFWGNGPGTMHQGLLSKARGSSCTLKCMPICNHRSLPYAQTCCVGVAFMDEPVAMQESWSAGQQCIALRSNVTFWCKHKHYIYIFVLLCYSEETRTGMFNVRFPWSRQPSWRLLSNPWDSCTNTKSQTTKK
jgi:hypothetical protein